MKLVDILITLVGAVLWGISPVLSKHLLARFSRYTIMIIVSSIYLLCLLLCLPFFNGHLKKDISNLTNIDILLLLFHGVFILFLGNVTYYYALKDNSSSLVNAIESSSPLITLILAYFILNEKIKPIGVVGIALIVLGILCISYNDKNINISEVFSNKK